MVVVVDGVVVKGPVLMVCVVCGWVDGGECNYTRLMRSEREWVHEGKEGKNDVRLQCVRVCRWRKAEDRGWMR